MKFIKKKNPRQFKPLKNIKLKDCGNIKLNIDEQFSLEFKKNISNDIVKKKWGYYLTNSINHTLKKNNFRTAFVHSKSFNRTFINLVHKSKMKEFNKYLKEQNTEILIWLDEYDF